MAGNHLPGVTLVIFGGAGDLAQRKLLPALYNLHVDGLLPERWAIVGTGRKELSDDAYRQFAREGITAHSRRSIDEQAWRTFAQGISFVRVELGSEGDGAGAHGLAGLGSRLDVIEHERGLPGNRIYYLAIPPSMFVPTVQELAHARFIAPTARAAQEAPADRAPYARLVIEKPIGHDLQSAMTIDDALSATLHERQIFRIDHYLGKETVQNILVLRFANSIFEPLFNHKYVDHVQITVAETEGVGTRAGFYESAGALRDMVQNHMLQLLALVAMEPPHALTADVVRDEKLEVIQSLRPITGDSVDHCTVRGQYIAGTLDGHDVPAYHRESGVKADSKTETFVALKVLIDNWRWAGVPFYLRTGKRLPTRASEISVHLKAVPPILFNAPEEALIGPCLHESSARLEPNVLAIRIQPDEGFELCISSKIPGPQVRVSPVAMDFRYSSRFGLSSPEAYERLLLDVMSGDATLFMRRDSVEASWTFVTPILERWAAREMAPSAYAAGTWGPDDADRLIAGAGRAWRPPSPAP